MKITIIIPTLNRKLNLDSTLDKIAPLLQKDFVDYVLILNNSDEKIKTKSHPKIKVINYGSKKSLLFMKNDALKKVTSRYTVIMDDDLDFNVNVFRQFIRSSKKYKFDLASPLVIANNNYKKPDLILYVKYCFFSFYKVGSLNYENLKTIQPHCVDFLPGCFIFGKTNAFKKIEYDENYILPYYNEDTDYTLNLKKIGLKMLVLPTIKIRHLKNPLGGTRNPQSLNNWYFAFGFNNAYFLIKNFNFFYYLLYSLFRFRDHLFVVKQFKYTIYKSYLAGILHGIKKARSVRFNS